MADLMTLRDVMRKTKLKRTTIYERMRAGTFPQPVKLSETPDAPTARSYWIAGEIDAWLDAAIAEFRKRKAS